MPHIFDTVRERHHSQAKLIASGRSLSEVSSLTGVPISQLERLSYDPAFRDLIARYRNALNADCGLARFQILASIAA